MADERDDTNPEASSPEHLAAGFAGETTGSFPASHSDADETLVSPAAETEKIGDFEILGKLGQGGMGAVYRVRQISLDRQVALKILPATLEADAEFVARFQREARIAASLNHANLVKVYSSGLADGCHYIAMELIEGENLGQTVKRGPLAPPDALRICLDVAKALQCGWDRAQLIHRDIKPGNIFLSEQGEVKVGDLGLAKSMSGDTTGLTNTGTAMGTPHYISPEQANGEKDLDFRADIYSLGCTLFQMLTGRTPYQGTEPMAVMNKHINAPPPAILKVLPTCPIPLARLVGKMLKKSKRERQGSYDELIAQIEDVQTLFALAASALESRLEPEETMLEAPAPTASARRPSDYAGKPKSKKLIYVTIGIGAAALVIITAFALQKQDSLTNGQQKEDGQLTATGVASTAQPSAPVVRQNASSRPVESLAIKLWDAPEKIPAPENGAQTPEWKDDALHLDKQVFLLFTRPSPTANAVARAKIRMNPTAVGQQVHLVSAGDIHYRLALWPSGGIVDAPNNRRSIQLLVSGNEKRLLKQWPWPRTFAPDEWVTLELRAIDGWLTASFDGAVLGKVQAQTEGKFIGMRVDAMAEGYFRDIEFVPLDGVADSQGVAHAEAWQNVLGNPADLELSGSVERVTEGLRFTAYGSANLPKDRGPKRDGAVRMRTTFGGSPPSLRARVTNTGAYVLFASEDNFIKLARYVHPGREFISFRNFRPREPLLRGEEYNLELRVEGKILTAKLNGEVLGSVSDDVLLEGQFGSTGDGSIAEPTILKVLEVLNLDAVDSAAITPATATKDTPFVNNLGMKFVPVPINSGPTASQRVLFSVWHTRVQDYTAYAAAKKVDDKWKKQVKESVPAGKEPNHPVVGVSWEDAQAFCQWLTEKENAEGKLPKGLKYRLPTDEEWSWAVGLPPEFGSTPKGKDKKKQRGLPVGPSLPAASEGRELCG